MHSVWDIQTPAGWAVQAHPAKEQASVESQVPESSGALLTVRREARHIFPVFQIPNTLPILKPVLILQGVRGPLDGAVWD